MLALARIAGLVFRQLFDSTSSTYTYILGDAASRQAILIDPVLEQVERDLSLLDEMGLQLTLAINTHCHADHITGSGKIKVNALHTSLQHEWVVHWTGVWTPRQHAKNSTRTAPTV